MKKITILLFFLVFYTTHSYAQQRASALQKKETTSVHYYTFSATVSQDKLDELEQALAKLEFVTQAKVKYKAEKGMGQVIMVVTQPQVIYENQKEFNPTSIKKALINMGFTPGQYSTGEYKQ